jgi:hypothetical protein
VAVATDEGVVGGVAAIPAAGEGEAAEAEAETTSDEEA